MKAPDLSIDSSGSAPLLISLVVPCFNEQEAIPIFYKEACAVLEELKQKNISGEFVFIDDGSKDKTLEILDQLSKKDDRVHYLAFSRNFGKEAALLAGLQKSKGNFVVTLDADGQDPLCMIPGMLEPVLAGEFDCAATRRVTRKGEPPVRSFFARIFYKIMGVLANIEIVDGARDYRLMNRAYADSILSLTESNRFSKGIFPWVGFRTKWFEYENTRRVAGETKWSFWKLFRYSIDGIMAFSAKPLAIASVLGILFFVVSIGLIGVIAVRRIVLGDPVAGWASTVCIILFCSGVQLFSTGILGAYLSKTYTEVKRRPHYLVKIEK
ncbi:MAG: glycosyltransferase [Acidobacteriota bacterium]|jgi:glycosyltransferase involved in cell wall biosynthesis|nr:glycosyltransferase [Acidobacteriota bacterium]